MESISEEKWHKTYRTPLALGVALCAPAAAFLLWIVPVVDRLPQVSTHAEAGKETFNAVVALHGEEERRDYASLLVQHGWGKDIVTARVWPQCDGWDDPPPACWTGVRNTVDEALLLRHLALDQHMSRIIIVTSRYHLLRAAAVFSVVFAGTGIDFHVVAPPPATRPSFRAAFSEFMKLVPSVMAAAVGRLAPSAYQRVMLFR